MTMSPRWTEPMDNLGRSRFSGRESWSGSPSLQAHDRGRPSLFWWSSHSSEHWKRLRLRASAAVGIARCPTMSMTLKFAVRAVFVPLRVAGEPTRTKVRDVTVGPRLSLKMAVLGVMVGGGVEVSGWCGQRARVVDGMDCRRWEDERKIARTVGVRRRGPDSLPLALCRGRRRRVFSCPLWGVHLAPRLD